MTTETEVVPVDGGQEGAEVEIELPGAEAPEGTGEEGQDPQTPKKEEKVREPWPKEAENKIRRLQRKLTQTRERAESYKRQLAETGESKIGKEPSEEDFENYGDFLKARQDYFRKYDNHAAAKEAVETGLKGEVEGIRAEQERVILEQASTLRTTNPEFDRALTENHDVILGMPPAIEELIYDLDDPVAAVYALAREGRLEALYHKSSTMAAAELLLAQQRGLGYLAESPKQPSAGGGIQRPQQSVATSQAPKPMGQPKSAGGGKSVSDMSADEVMKWLKT